MPPRASELKVCPGAVGLFGPRTLSSPPPVGLPRSGTPEGSLTNAFVQVLLRRRIVLQWLSAHNGSSCARSGEDDGECFACLLRETLAQMHLPSRAGMARSSPLAVNAAWAKSCIDVGLRKLFQSLSTSGGPLPWPGVSDFTGRSLTALESVIGFLITFVGFFYEHAYFFNIH